MSALLIANPTAGRRRPDAAPESLLAALAASGVQADLYGTTRRGDAEEAGRPAADDGRELIVVAGGDGTINEVANGLAGSSVPICLVPCGTENVVAKELGLPMDLPAACAVAASGVTRAVDTGVCSGRTFLMAAGVGFDAAIVRGVSLRLKRRLGEGAYWVAGLWQIARARPAAYTLSADGKQIAGRYYGLIASNMSSYAGRANVFTDARVDDGLLDAYLIKSGSYVRFVRAILRLLKGTPVSERDLERVTAASLEVKAECPQPVQLDGDDFADTPVNIAVRPGSLHVLVPRQPTPPAQASSASTARRS